MRVSTVLRGLTSREVDTLFSVFSRFTATTGYEDRRDVYADLLKLFRADGLVSAVWNDEKNAFAISNGLNIDPANLALWQGHYQFHDPIRSAFEKSSAAIRKRAYRVTEVMRPGVLRKTDFYRNVLRKDGISFGLGTYVYDDQSEIGSLMFWRRENKCDFGEGEGKLLDLIAPHFRNAIRNARLICKMQGMENFWKNMLEETGIALFLFDENGCMVYRNSHADVIEKELLTEQYALFRQYLGNAIRENHRPGQWGSYQFSILSTVPPGESKQLTAVFAWKAASREVDVNVLKKKCGLSSRELQICLLTCKGLSTPEIARTLEIAPSTVRSHMKNMFQKLDVSKRSEFVYRLFSTYFDTTL